MTMTKMTITKTTKLMILAAGFGLFSTSALADHGGFGGKNFSNLDSDGNGSISLEEFKAPMADRFAAMDSDNSGEVSLAEMQAYGEERRGNRGGKMGGKMKEVMFKGLDADNSGGISQSEMAAMHDAETRFGELDTDGDGALSQEELKAARGDKGHGKKGCGGH